MVTFYNLFVILEFYYMILSVICKAPFNKLTKEQKFSIKKLLSLFTKTG